MKRHFALLCLALATVAGCNERRDDKLRLGVVNTARILEESSQYKDLRTRIQRERNDFLATLPTDMKHISQTDANHLREESQKKQSEWEKRTMETIQQSMKQISDLTSEVAKQKNLDLVVINTPYTNSVYYNGGQDITIDVLLKLQNQK